MSSVHIHSIPISCQLDELCVVTAHSPEDLTHTVLPSDDAFSVQVSLAFLGTNARSLLALAPTIQVDFYAKPLQAGATIDLGTTVLDTVLQQMSYTAALHLGSPRESNLTKATVYRIGALVRIGALEQPAMLCGVLDDLIVQIHRPQQPD